MEFTYILVLVVQFVSEPRERFTNWGFVEKYGINWAFWKSLNQVVMSKNEWMVHGDG